MRGGSTQIALIGRTMRAHSAIRTALFPLSDKPVIERLRPSQARASGGHLVTRLGAGIPNSAALALENFAGIKNIMRIERTLDQPHGINALRQLIDQKRHLALTNAMLAG